MEEEEDEGGCCDIDAALASYKTVWNGKRPTRGQERELPHRVHKFLPGEKEQRGLEVQL